MGPKESNQTNTQHLYTYDPPFQKSWIRPWGGQMNRPIECLKHKFYFRLMGK